MIRARFCLLALATTAFVLAAMLAGCSSQESPPAGSDASATAAPASSGSGSGYTTVDVQTASAALDADPGAQLVDVREPAEWAETGFPQGAALISLGELESRAAELKSEQPVYVICRTGHRSVTGSELLARLGFSKVFNVAGGVTAWLQVDLPMETYQP